MEGRSPISTSKEQCAEFSLSFVTATSFQLPLSISLSGMHQFLSASLSFFASVRIYILSSIQLHITYPWLSIRILVCLILLHVLISTHRLFKLLLSVDLIGSWNINYLLWASYFSLNINRKCIWFTLLCKLVDHFNRSELCRVSSMFWWSFTSFSREVCVCAHARMFMLMVILEIGGKISTGCITVFSLGMGTCRIFKRENESMSVPKWIHHFSWNLLYIITTILFHNIVNMDYCFNIKRLT